MPSLVLLKTKGKGAPKAEKGGPDPAKLISGKYLTQTWNHWEGENGRLLAGIWESSPGKVSCEFTEWEFCHIISGEVIVTEQGQKKGQRFRKGDAFIFPPGFKGTWETVKKVKKHYVILLPQASS